MNYLKAIVVVLLATNSILSFGINSLCISDSVPVAPKDSVYWKRFGEKYERDTAYGEASSLPLKYDIERNDRRFSTDQGIYYLLPDSSHFWILSNRTNWKNDNREVRLFIPRFNNLEFFFLYNDSMLIESISIDHLKMEFNGTIVGGALSLNFRDGVSFIDAGSQVFTVPNFGYFEIYFHPNNQMKSFGFYPFTQDYQSYLMEFRPDLTIRSYGFLQGNCPVGTWLYYDENGLVEKITENALVDRQHIEKVVFEKGKSTSKEVPK